MQEYLDFVQTLKPEKLNHGKVSFRGWEVALEHFIDAGNRLDNAKKGLAYGKVKDDSVSTQKRLADRHKITPYAYDRRLDHLSDRIDDDVLHGLLGIVTEASELAEILRNVSHNGPGVDQVNLLEELGDILWYMALICHAQGTTFENLMGLNMAKLKRRFPEKFTQEAALNRDVDAEREVMAGDLRREKGMNPVLGMPYTKEGVAAGAEATATGLPGYAAVVEQVPVEKGFNPVQGMGDFPEADTEADFAEKDVYYPYSQEQVETHIRVNERIERNSSGVVIQIFRKSTHDAVRDMQEEGVEPE